MYSSPPTEMSEGEDGINREFSDAYDYDYEEDDDNADDNNKYEFNITDMDYRTVRKIYPPPPPPPRSLH